jgi:putative colanic acid biosynthesis acetyltransferase WcaF
MKMNLDIKQCRSVRNYTKKDYIIMGFWRWGGLLIYRCIPEFFYGTRNGILRLFGAKVGRNTRISRSVWVLMPHQLIIGDYVGIGERVRIYNNGFVKVCDRATISQNSIIYAGSHDYSLTSLPLEKRPVIIEKDSWVAGSAIIGPGSRIRSGSIIGFGSVFQGETEPNGIYIGNRAVLYKIREIHEK